MHQNAFGGRVPPGPAVGAYIAPPDSLAGFKGMGGEGIRGRKCRRKEGKREKGKVGEGKRREREGEGGPPRTCGPLCPPSPNSGALEPPLFSSG